MFQERRRERIEEVEKHQKNPFIHFIFSYLVIHQLYFILGEIVNYIVYALLMYCFPFKLWIIYIKKKNLIMICYFWFVFEETFFTHNGYWPSAPSSVDSNI